MKTSIYRETKLMIWQSLLVHGPQSFSIEDSQRSTGDGFDNLLLNSPDNKGMNGQQLRQIESVVLSLFIRAKCAGSS